MYRLTLEEGIALLCGKTTVSNYRVEAATVRHSLCKIVLELVVLHPIEGILESQINAYFHDSLRGHCDDPNVQARQAKDLKELCSQNSAITKNVIGSILRFLCNENFIGAEKTKKLSLQQHKTVEMNAESKQMLFDWRFKATRLGIATIHSAMSCYQVLNECHENLFCILYQYEKQVTNIFSWFIFDCVGSPSETTP